MFLNQENGIFYESTDTTAMELSSGKYELQLAILFDCIGICRTEKEIGLGQHCMQQNSWIQVNYQGRLPNVIFQFLSILGLKQLRLKVMNSLWLKKGRIGVDTYSLVEPKYLKT